MKLGRPSTPLGISLLLAVAFAAPGPVAPASAQAAGAPASVYRLDALQVAIRLDRPAGAALPVSALPPGGGEPERLGTIAPGGRSAAFVVSRRHLAPDGGLTLTVGAAGGGALGGWVHLLPLPADGTVAVETGGDDSLRPRSLAYARLSDLAAGASVRIGLRSHTLDGAVDGAGTLASLRLDGEVLPGARGATVIPGRLVVREVEEEAGTTRVEWLHEDANPLRLSIERKGDRFRYTYEYEVVRSLDRAVPVATRFTLPGGFSALESLTWRRWTRWQRNRPPQFRADTAPGDEPLSFSQYPFQAGRGGSGAYIGVLDAEGSSLFGRAHEAEDAFDVEMWMWPRTVGQTYRWTFDVVAGHEPFANAFLRALEPYTIDNHSDFAGGMHGPLGVLDSVEEARQAYANGVRVVYLHAWFPRNGLYFLPDQAMDESYMGMWGETYSYDRLKRQVENGQAGGLKVYVYFQFAGVSEDIADRFAPSIVATGDTMVAGHDGGLFGAPWINNLWANPDPDGPYGRSFLEQMDRMIEVIQPDGLYLDRMDRLDFTYASGYDYGSFNGYASPRLPGAEPRPATSITREGVRMYHRMREVLDARGSSLWSNLSTTLPAFATSDLTMIDQPMTPWSLFFMRAGSNGKPLYIMERANHETLTTEEKCLDNKLVAWLSRSHPMLSRNGEDADLCPEPLQVSYANPRLQYVIPTDDPYPAYWLFEDGTTVFRHDPEGSSVSARFSGSTFVPLSPNQLPF